MFINRPARSFFLSVCLGALHSLIHSPTRLCDQSVPNLSSFAHSRDLISVYRFQASFSAQAQVFYIPAAFWVADRSVTGWGLVLQAVVTHKNVCFGASPTFCADHQCNTCHYNVFLFYSKGPMLHSVFYSIDFKRQDFDLIQIRMTFI